MMYIVHVASFSTQLWNEHNIVQHSDLVNLAGSVQSLASLAAANSGSTLRASTARGLRALMYLAFAFVRMFRRNSVHLIPIHPTWCTPLDSKPSIASLSLLSHPLSVVRRSGSSKAMRIGRCVHVLMATTIPRGHSRRRGFCSAPRALPALPGASHPGRGSLGSLLQLRWEGGSGCCIAFHSFIQKLADSYNFRLHGAALPIAVCLHSGWRSNVPAIWNIPNHPLSPTCVQLGSKEGHKTKMDVRHMPVPASLLLPYCKTDEALMLRTAESRTCKSNWLRRTWGRAWSIRLVLHLCVLRVHIQDQKKKRVMAALAHK